MSNEVAVPEPLSGTEIIEAIKVKVGEQLQRDCFLSPNSAYEYFTGKISIEVIAVDCGREVTIKTEVDVQLGDPLLENTENSMTAESSETIDRQPPNVVRRETGQSVPVITEDTAGVKEMKRVKYQRESEKPIPQGGSKSKHKAAAGRKSPPPVA